MICANYWGISVLPIAYKVLTSVLCERLKPHPKVLIAVSDLASPPSTRYSYYAKFLKRDMETKRKHTTFRVIELESVKMGLAVNDGKTKYMLTTSGVVPRLGSQITANSYNFDVVREFIYLGTAINTNNDVSLDVL